MSLKIAYFGTPEIAAQLLSGISNNANSFSIELVVTQPDKPKGKRLALSPSPVKKIAKQLKIDVYDSSPKSGELITLLQRKEVDLAIVFAYGEILPESLLKSITHGFINIHPSLLPLYRGPSPTAYPLLLGDEYTGVSLIQLTSKLDRGPIIMQERVAIPPRILREGLEKLLTDLSISMTIKLLPNINTLQANKTLQSEDQATYTRLLNKSDGYISLITLQKAIRNEQITSAELPLITREYMGYYSQKTINMTNSGKIIFDYFRALTPWPGVWTEVKTTQGDKRLKLLELEIDRKKLAICTVQLEGKNPVDFRTFNKAYNIFS